MAGGVDYDPVVLQLPFLPGELSKEVAINITDELLPEEDEIFQLSLSLVGQDRVVLRTTEANVTIVDNDSESYIRVYLFLRSKPFYMYIALFLQPGNKASRYIAHRLVKLVGCEDVLFTFELVLLVTQLKIDGSPLPIFCSR